MAKSKVLEQHIAVFGESGSGKTVLLSSFYGSAQEPQYIKSSPFDLLAENPSQGTRLVQNYLGMKKSATVPETNRFSATSYSFLLKLKGEPPATKPAQANPFDALRLVWHDYPGDWFEQDVSGAEEAKRRVETFRALLRSDVALLLVDGQRLLDNANEEERYLKSLFSDFRNGLLLLKDDLLEDGEPLVEFPRIWVVALSKADVLPNLNVYDFRDLVIEKAGDDIVGLREVLGGLLESSSALSVGEDFVLLSSAKFGAEKIEVAQRIGLNLILPMAAVLPFERHIRWAHAGQVSRKVALELMGGAEAVAVAMGAVGRLAAILIGRKSKLAGAVGLMLNRLGPGLEEAAKKAEEKLAEAHAVAAAKQDRLAAVLGGFRKDLDTSEERNILVRSAR